MMDVSCETPLGAKRTMPPFLREGRSLNLWRVGVLYMTQPACAVKQVARVTGCPRGLVEGVLAGRLTTVYNMVTRKPRHHVKREAE